MMDASFGLRETTENTITLGGVAVTFGPLAAANTFDDGDAFYYSESIKKSSYFIGIDLPSYGVQVTVLKEKEDLSQATLSISAP